MSDVIRTPSGLEQGDSNAAAELLPLVYSELRKLAAQKIARENPGQTLQATALVHEAYLRLLNGEGGQKWSSRRHFFAAAAEAMRRILIEQARRKNSLKGGGQRQRVEFDDAAPAPSEERFDLLDLDEALARLQVEEPRMSELVKLRFFAGLDLADAAAVLEISTATAKRDWVYARAWLYGVLSAE